MRNKCFLYIDGYPRNASDIPFSIAIDWGDGSEVEQYSRLFVEKIPQLYHVYEDATPRTITVTITNLCGQATQTIGYAPFVPPDCQCRNEYYLDRNSLVVNFTDVEWDVAITGCFMGVKWSEYDALISAKLVTDVSTNLPLITFRRTFTPLPDSTFSLASQVIPTEAAVENILTHLQGFTDWDGGGGGDLDDDLSAVPAYVFPFEYLPNGYTGGTWATPGKLHLHRESDGVLFGVGIPKPCVPIRETSRYFEFTQTVEFEVPRVFDLPEDTKFEKEVTWRVPRPGLTYWQYTGPDRTSTSSIDALHIMSMTPALLPMQSTRSAVFKDINKRNTVTVMVDVWYVQASRTYRLDVADCEPFLFEPERLSSSTADFTVP